jgi:ribosomal protein L11
MPPKGDPNEVVQITLRVTGGEVPGGSSLAPKIGPLGLVRWNYFKKVKNNRHLLYFDRLPKK